ncbi:MAG: ATP-dependent zinc metalloprotease FtsH [Candidatus Omnitrophica bacterium]|nr:ATP-dependent zinc metalloprotease FtsH [Candidatus Omnitrophota bacterium]
MPPKKPDKKTSNGRNVILLLLIIFGITYLVQWATLTFEKAPQELSYKDFYTLLKNNLTEEKISSAVKTEEKIYGSFSDGSKYTVNVPVDDPELLNLLRENVKQFDIKPPRTFFANLFYSLGPMVLFILFLWFFIYRGAASGGGRVFAFGKSRAKLATDEHMRITFEDVAGVDEAKEELKEVIEFLKDPRKFQRLGGKMPKGILVVGPPGTGKTLLAKAVAGEAKVPFFSISGSDFVEMFVGVGASRVRDLFEQAKKSVKITRKGCIIFLDEIDAVGRQRFAGIGGGHDEREQTLNALLVEMDGFDTQEGVILIAATNRPDVLDPALLRPGRFDRHVVIDRPDIIGREAILRVHARKIKMDEHVNLKRIASQTPGFSGADLANLINEAALLGARRNKDAVTQEELEESIERVMAGPQRKSRVITKAEKKIIAYHESGHALLSLLTPEADPMHKVTIISRGMALGYTFTPPKEDRYITTKGQMIAKLIVALGGRAAEELIFRQFSTGAHNDLSVVSEIARDMITQFGMSERLGHLTYGKRHEQIFLGRDLHEEKNYSDETAMLIDQEVKRLVDECYSKAMKTLARHRHELRALTEMLLVKEVVDDKEVRKLLKLHEDEVTGDSGTETDKKDGNVDVGQQKT